MPVGEPYVPIWQRTPSLNDRQTERYAKAKHEIPTKLAEKTASDKDEKRDERAWKKACIKRDGKICRCCKRVVVPQLELAANRLEVHHVAGRADQVVRWDARNGIVLCAGCHGNITERRLWILQAARLLFKADNGKTYINASKKVTFSEKAAA